MGDKLAGFIELRDEGYIDCLYVHPKYQKCGLTTAFYQHVESLAIRRAYKTLTADVSKSARGFFLRNGFVLIHENQIQRGGQILSNFRMFKKLA